jgi:hypothetical protein
MIQLKHYAAMHTFGRCRVVENIGYAIHEKRRDDRDTTGVIGHVFCFPQQSLDFLTTHREVATLAKYANATVEHH